MQTTAQRRLAKEWKDLTVDAPPNISAAPIGPELLLWEALIFGPQGTPYEGGVFKLELRFPREYPFKAPIVRFITRIYHCNINSEGAICLDILKDNWAPSLTVTKVLLSICSLLSDPNPNDALVPNIANLYLTNRNQHNKMAQKATQQFATG